MKRLALAAIVLTVAGVALAASLPAEKPLPAEKVNVRAKALDAKAAPKFDHRTWGEVIIRQEGTYTVLIKAPDGTLTTVATAACAPAAGKKVVLRVMVDAVEVAETPPPKPKKEITE